MKGLLFIPAVRLTVLSLMCATALSACGPTYSPDTYASNAAQQANKVEQGVIVGVRTVGVSASGTVGTVTGAAAGGIAGSQVAAGPVSAFTALGGSLVGGLAGSTVEHATADTVAFEYIVRKPNGDLVSVTQKDKKALVLGQKVLVIAGVQARVLPDYTVPPEKPTEMAKAPDSAKTDSAKTDTARTDTGKTETKPSDTQAADDKPAETKSGDPAVAIVLPPATPAETKPITAALDTQASGTAPMPVAAKPGQPATP